MRDEKSKKDAWNNSDGKNLIFKGGGMSTMER
jgi:hypothetical protein